jgi:hypothetical protein
MCGHTYQCGTLDRQTCTHEYTPDPPPSDTAASDTQAPGHWSLHEHTGDRKHVRTAEGTHSIANLKGTLAQKWPHK